MLVYGEVILRLLQIFKSDHHKLHTEEVNMIVLTSDDDKRLQTFDGIETYQYGTNAFKMCEREIMLVRDLLVKNMYIVCFMVK